MFPIPKIIHLTYKSLEEIPDKWKDVLLAWKKFYPDWEIRFWNDNDNEKLITENFPWFIDTWNNFPYIIQKIDAVRACYLYLFGGLYMDMDYLPLKSINELFENNDCELYFTQSSNVPTFTNSLMASKPGQNFWITYLESMQGEKFPWYYTKHFIVMHSTGPMKLDRLLKKHQGIIGYIPANLVHPCSVCDKSCKSVNSYFQTLDGRTWNSNDSKILNYVYCNYKNILLVIFFLLVILIIYIKYRFYKCGICERKLQTI